MKLIISRIYSYTFNGKISNINMPEEQVNTQNYFSKYLDFLLNNSPQG